MSLTLSSPSQVALHRGHVQISNLKCSYAGAGRHVLKHKYYMSLCADGPALKTAVVPLSNGRTISWDETFDIEGSDTSTLKLQIFSRNLFGCDKCVVEFRETILQFINEKDVMRSLPATLNSKSGQRTFTASFTISRHMPVGAEAANYQMNQVFQSAANIIPANGPLDNSPVDRARAMSANVEPIIVAAAPLLLGPLVQSLQRFMNIMEKVSQIHPYAQLAWSIISAAHNIYQAQLAADNSVIALVTDMEQMYDLINATLPLNDLSTNDALKKTLGCITRQTAECGYFIEDYCRRKNFWARLMANLGMEIQGKVEEYRSQFRSMLSSLHSQTAVETDITVLRIWNMLSDAPPLTRIDLCLQEMPYAKGASWRPERACLPGTRADIVAEICSWANTTDEHAPRVLLLTGVAGSGKSTIAHTVARQFSALGRLGSMFSFDVGKTAERHPGNVLSTIARDLAAMDDSWTRFLAPLIEKPAARTTSSPLEQFDFILTPALNINRADANVITVGPIVIVIDALNECGGREDRALLLHILSHDTTKLPPNFRILITARAELDIEDTFRDQSHVLRRRMDDINWQHSTKQDIAAYIRNELPNIERDDIDWLADKSECLFQWANVACRFINGDGKWGFDALSRLEELKKYTDNLNDQLRSLPAIYSGILQRTFPLHNSTFRSHFIEVVGWIVAAREPLSKTALWALGLGSNADEQQKMVNNILGPLGSLLSGIHDDHTPIAPLHSSFRDFLEAQFTNGPDMIRFNRGLALGSIRTMIKELRFNICDFESSHVSNAEALHLHEHVQTRISDILSYSARFWAYHLDNLPYDELLAKEVEVLMYEHILHWLEVLSLINEVRNARRLLLSAARWLWGKNRRLELFIEDAMKFVGVFGTAISHSTPHVYLSAVPFSPSASVIARVFLPKLPNRLFIKKGQLARWPVIRLMIPGHAARVSCVAYSKDGRRIASGSWDKTVRIWDAETGVSVAAPCVGHTAAILSVAFSPDGRRIASGSGDMTIRVWDSTGIQVADPFQGHSGPVHSVMYSPDGKHIVSGSGDGTIRLWNADSGTSAGGPFAKGHNGAVFSVAFSPTGGFIVSGARNMIRVWGKKGTIVSDLISSDLEDITSIAISPNGRHIASTSFDGKLRVWDVLAGELIAGPFGYDNSSIFSIAFSPNGGYIATGSDDEAIRVWNANTGDLVLSLFGRHQGGVFSVAFSPDGTFILSGSSDKTIRMWDASIAVQITSPLASVDSFLDALPPDTTHDDVLPSSHDEQHDQVWNMERDNDFTDNPEILDGWIISAGGKLLFWVPPWAREELARASHTLLNGRYVDLRRFAHGRKWFLCMKQ